MVQVSVTTMDTSYDEAKLLAGHLRDICNLNAICYPPIVGLFRQRWETVGIDDCGESNSQKMDEEMAEMEQEAEASARPKGSK
jgi:hypothetical protein